MAENNIYIDEKGKEYKLKSTPVGSPYINHITPIRFIIYLVLTLGISGAITKSVKSNVIKYAVLIVVAFIFSQLLLKKRLTEYQIKKSNDRIKELNS